MPDRGQGRSRSRGPRESVRPLLVGCSGKGIPDGGQIGCHLLVNRAQNRVLEGCVQTVERVARRAQIQRIAGSNGLVDRVSARLIDALNIAANPLERLEEADVGGINHLADLSDRKPASPYSTAP